MEQQEEEDNFAGDAEDYMVVDHQVKVISLSLIISKTWSNVNICLLLLLLLLLLFIEVRRVYNLTVTSRSTSRSLIIFRSVGL